MQAVDRGDAIRLFLASTAFAVAGASNDRQKFGNKVLRCYQQNYKKVYPVNPHERFIEGLTAVTKVSELPATVNSLSIVTPPPITEKILEQAISKGIKNIWLQPGAESEHAISFCENNGINLIAGGACILVVLGFSD